MPTGDCFHCHRPSHWARDCPLKTPTKPTTVSSSPPVIHCPYHGGKCVVLTSKTEKNPNRRFYKCSAAPSCGFFKWSDQVSIKSEPISVFPTCPCGAGPCRRVTAIDGSNAYRSYFVCCNKKGFGACGFFQWEDDNAQTAYETEEAGHGGSPCSTLIGFKEFDADETVGEESICSRFNNLELASSGVFASEDGRNQVYKDAVRFETEEQILSSLAPKHIETQVEALYSDHITNRDLLGFGGQKSYALEVNKATRVLSKTGSNSTNKLEHQSISCAETGDSVLESSSLMDLIKQFNSEKFHFESVSPKHGDALTAFMGELFEVEKQVKLYEAESSDFATSLQEVCSEMVKSQKQMVETAGKVAKEVRVHKQR